MTDIRFDGRVAVVTGAGGGLGEAYALELARRGCKVVVNDLGGGRDGQGAGHGMADQVVEKIRAVCGEAVASYAGVHSAEGGLSIVDTAMSRWGRLDILINNAGILRDRSFANMNEDEWRAVIDVHLHGAYYVTHSAFRVMKERGYGRILFTTSVSGMFGNFGQANYAAAKMGQLGLMNVLAIEGAKYGIKTNAISPAAATRMTEDLNRSGQPRVSRDIHHVTPAAVYLVSEACQANGAIIHASNGFFGATQMAYNPGVFLGPSPVSVEAFAARWAEISRMDEAIQVQKETPYLRYVLEKAAAGGGA